MIGPPMLPPYWFWRNAGFGAEGHADASCTSRFQSGIAVVSQVEVVVRVGVQDFVSEELESRSVKAVRAGLRDDVHHGAARAAYRSVVLVRRNVHFLNRVDRRPRADRADDALVVIETVDHALVFRVALAVRGECRRLTAVIGPVARCDRARRAFRGARGKLNQLYDVATIQRQVLHGLCRDESAQSLKYRSAAPEL